MKSVRVSVVIPCFNDGKYLLETIESVQNQSFRELEIIVVDDYSTDQETLRILNRLQVEKKANIQILQSIEKGVANARNIGINHAKGEYILPLDADDLIAPTYIEKAVKILDENKNMGIVYCYADLFGEKSGRWNLPNYSRERMLWNNVIFVTALFRKSDWNTIGGFSNELEWGLEDYDFWLSIIELRRDVFQIPESLFKYRIKQVSRTTIMQDSNKNLSNAYYMILKRHKKLLKTGKRYYLCYVRIIVLRYPMLKRIYKQLKKCLERCK